MKTVGVEQIEEIAVYREADNPWVQLYFDRVRFPDGTIGRYNKIVERGGKRGVAILPLAPDRVGLIRLYRYPLGTHVWEMPRGFGEEDTIESDAVRELKEETGLTPARLLPLGFLNPNSGLLASTVALFAAVCEDHTAPTSRLDSEVTSFHWKTRNAVLEMIVRDEIRDAFALAMILRAQCAGIW